MEHNFPAADRPVRIPPIAWFLGVSLLVVLAAIFVFNIPVTTVGFVAFIAFCIGSHFFMHGSHGGHGSHAGHKQRTDAPANADGPAGAVQSNSVEHAGHAGSRL